MDKKLLQKTTSRNGTQIPMANGDKAVMLIAAAVLVACTVIFEITLGYSTTFALIIASWVALFALAFDACFVYNREVRKLREALGLDPYTGQKRDAL